MVKKCVCCVLPVLFLGACVTVPVGPSVMVLPGTGKPFEQFQVDDAVCRQWALQQTGIAPAQASGASAAGSAAIGALIGAAAGAAIGAASGHAGTGAAIGAGGGLIAGTAVGGSHAHGAGAWVQRQYDVAYQQCMYAKGNQIPGVTYPSRRSYPPPPPPASGAPAPPDPWAHPPS